jgi:putative transposase
VRKPFPDWVDYTPNSIWIHDTPLPSRRDGGVDHRRPGLAEVVTEVVSVEDTSTQVELAFIAALDAEGLLDAVDAPRRHDARHDDGSVDLATDDQAGRSCSRSPTTVRR